MPKKMKPILYVLPIFLMMLISMGCQGKNKATVEKETIPVRVIKAERQSIKKILDYVDDIRAQDEAIIYPKVNGKIIEKIKEEGSSVNKGDVIAYIDRDEVGFKFEKAPVESPLRGTIGRVYVDKGSSVTPQSPIALVVDMDKVKIKLDITEEYLSRIALGQEAQVSLQAYPNEKFIGVVLRISPVLDLETRTAPIEVIIPNSDHRLKSGMFAQVQLILEEHKDVVVIAKEAIMGREAEVYVYVVESNIAHQKSIKLGIRQGAFYEIKEGLKAGDLVVIMGQQKLYDGAPVIIEEK